MKLCFTTHKRGLTHTYVRTQLLRFKKRKEEKFLKIYTKVFCLLLVATFLCLFRVSPASAFNPFPNNPICASKTLPNQFPYNTWFTPLSGPNSLAGWCYIPIFVPPGGFLRIEELYDDQLLAGDVAGGAAYVPGGIDYPLSAFKIIYPEGKVNIVDIANIAKAFAAVEGVPPPWNYMADVYQDKRINIQDVATAAKCFNHVGPYFWPYLAPLAWDPAYGVQVQFFSAGLPVGPPVPPDPLGVVPIPPPADSFVVTYLGGPVVGNPAPAVPGQPIGAIVTWWNVYP
jgi:hypothetical protein